MPLDTGSRNVHQLIGMLTSTLVVLGIASVLLGIAAILDKQDYVAGAGAAIAAALSFGFALTALVRK